MSVITDRPGGHKLKVSATQRPNTYHHYQPRRCSKESSYTHSIPPPKPTSTQSLPSAVRTFRRRPHHRRKWRHCRHRSGCHSCPVFDFGEHPEWRRSCPTGGIAAGTETHSPFRPRRCSPVRHGPWHTRGICVGRGHAVYPIGNFRPTKQQADRADRER